MAGLLPAQAGMVLLHHLQHIFVAHRGAKHPDAAGSQCRLQAHIGHGRRHHQIAGKLSEKPAACALDGYNLFVLRLQGAEEIRVAKFEKGGVRSVPALRRDGKVLPTQGLFGWVLQGLRHSAQLEHAIEFIEKAVTASGEKFDNKLHARITECLDAMVRDGWVKAKLSTQMPPIEFEFPLETAAIRKHVETA